MTRDDYRTLQEQIVIDNLCVYFNIYENNATL